MVYEPSRGCCRGGSASRVSNYHKSGSRVLSHSITICGGFNHPLNFSLEVSAQFQEVYSIIKCEYTYKASLAYYIRSGLLLARGGGVDERDSHW